MTTVTERMQKGRGKKKVGGAATSSNSRRGLPKAKFASLSYRVSGDGSFLGVGDYRGFAFAG
jgi:hypothetical protein